MKDNYVITIARGYGSGGSHIATALSQKLGIPYYDEDILRMASDLSGINETYFWEANEKINKGKIAIATSKGAYTGDIYPINHKMHLSNENLFNYQAKVIRDLAIHESCIIVGKAANYILRTFNNVLSVNIQAPEDYCVKNIMERCALNSKDALAKIKETNTYRANYYKYYTGCIWNDASQYDLSISTNRITEDEATEIILDQVKKRFGK